jgi:hypothetical protein
VAIPVSGKRIVDTIFVNEYGNEIRMSIEIQEMYGVVNKFSPVVVSAEGPTSEITHTWTVKEALALHKLLGALPLPKLR